MTALTALWLPILLATVVLFFASFLAWAVLPHHTPDVKRWPDEDALLRFIRESGATPGEYLFPLIEPKAMKEDWAVKRYDAGPWGQVNVWAGKPNMGGNLVKTLLFFAVVSILVAYVAATALAPGTAFGEVFRVVGATAVLAYTSGGVLREIWFTRPLRAKLMDALDGVVYGLITAALFATLWPGS